MISGLEFLLAEVTVGCAGVCVGLADGSEGAEGGEQEPELDKLNARDRPSLTAGMRLERVRRRRFFSSSVRTVLPGGDQSKSFFKCPRPHRQPHALKAKS
ncbi:hypothetical protein EVAR_18747_1 [Eumeta japonica]|uniref:Secreted protein n=1 Tax=Eumeta variegata TaxID=151549 RepID=A0A4C1UM64_EUMVA|nr:hypothetical protein EVAR_18747_1 [Eumeta japonica]